MKTPNDTSEPCASPPELQHRVFQKGRFAAYNIGAVDVIYEERNGQLRVIGQVRPGYGTKVVQDLRAQDPSTPYSFETVRQMWPVTSQEHAAYERLARDQELEKR